MGRLITLPSGARAVTGPAWSGVQYYCTTRQGGVSLPPYDGFNLGDHVHDDAHAVQTNRRQLVQALPAQPLWLNQVHGVAVHPADQVYAKADPPQADAALTTRPGQVLAVLTADCLPVVLGDDQGRAIAVAHAGWRGLAAGVLEHTLAGLRQRLALADVTWRAWIGPGIGAAHFEVGQDVLDAFVAHDIAASQHFRRATQAGKWYADLSALAAQRLRRQGVIQIWQSAWCTYAHPDLFFSHRRQQPTGRMVTVAWRTAVSPGASDLP